MENVKDRFTSKDFYLVAVCLAAGCTLNSLDRTSGAFVNFVLDDSASKCEEIISRHWSGELKISSRRIIEAINELKTRLHSGV
jgi:hypothetical protein